MPSKKGTKPSPVPFSNNYSISDVSALQVLGLQLLYSIICRAGGEGHVGQGGVLRSRRGHAGTVGNEYIFAGMQLIEFIEH